MIHLARTRSSAASGPLDGVVSRTASESSSSRTGSGSKLRLQYGSFGDAMRAVAAQTAGVTRQILDDRQSIGTGGQSARGGSGDRIPVGTPPPPPAAPPPPPVDNTPALDPKNMMMYSGTVQYVRKPEVPQAPKQTLYDAYWATQPPEIQQLRDLKSEPERAAKAKELAAQGFSVDVPIQVWGWDPLVTMQARQSAGYTWVPSGGMKPVTVAPGVDFPSTGPAYDPNNPPPGAIQVTTEWAKGLENTSPWWRLTHPDGVTGGFNNSGGASAAAS